ncbi:hypothetical protein F4778DRAFT_784741 [Xylariomycetidae sp. FL2044]|nr:hypothetical protein F4778DRAFT_784741 [Xylariomycetidae sp. FL2044]
MTTTSTWTLPVVISPPLSPREAIADTMYRCFAGLDTPDPALWESAFTPDAVCIVDDRAVEGLGNINAQIYEPTARLDTTHFMTNMRIHIHENGTEATLSASALAQHYRPGTGRQLDAPRLLAGGPYIIQLIRDDAGGGLWKIKRFQMGPRWTEGDLTVMTG